MRVWSFLKYGLPLLLAVGLFLLQCRGDLGVTDGDGDTDTDADADGYDVQPGCDPDNGSACPDDYFFCVDTEAGKTCTGQVPAVPGSGDWECQEQGTTLICEGDHDPAAEGSGWYCEDDDEDGTWTCRRHGYIPAGGADENYNCYYGENNIRICESTDASPPDGDGDVDADGDVDGDTDADADADGPPDDCLCIPGAWRYCDTPAYCLWGIQYCNPDGLSWGDCDETTIPAACIGVDAWYSPAAAECCVANGFCCQDMWDGDRDSDTWESRGNCTDIVCI